MRNTKKYIFILSALLILLLLYSPIILVITKGLNHHALIKVLSSQSYYSMYFFTIYQATISTFFSMLIGLPIAYIISNYHFKGKKIIHVLTLIPFVVPSILLVLGFIIVWGNQGIVNQGLEKLLIFFRVPHTTPVFPLLYSFPAIIIAHVFYNFGIFAHIVSTRWATLSHSQVCAAQNLGASRWHIYKGIIFPHLKPAIFSASTVVFLFCFTSFAIILILGGGPWYSTLETAIYKLVKIEFNFTEASILALIQMLTTFSITLFFLRSQKYSAFSTMNKPLVPLSQSRMKYILYSYLTIIYGLVCVLFLAVMIMSFFYTSKGHTSMGIYGYTQLFQNTKILSSIVYSIIVSVSSTGIAFLASLYIAVLLCAYRKQSLSTLVQSLLFFPYFISPIILSFSYTYLKRFFISESLMLLIVVHGILTVPFLTRLISNTLSQIKLNIVYSAKTLGAGLWQLLSTIYIPLSIPSIIVACSLSICISLGELSASLMLAPKNRYPIPVMLYNLLYRYRFLDATRAGVILIVLTAVLLMCIDGMGKKIQRRKLFASMF